MNVVYFVTRVINVKIDFFLAKKKKKSPDIHVVFIGITTTAMLNS